MTAQIEMFGETAADRYPQQPGYKAPGPSQEAARRIAGHAAQLRAAVLDELRRGPATADEIATRLGRSILSVRPRVSELNADGKIAPTAQRRRNESGASATVWQVTP